MKIITIVGARPQFVKAAVVSRAIARHNETYSNSCIEEKILHTGQHYDTNMSDIFFREMQIPKPLYHLQIGGGTHGAMTGRMLEQIEAVLLKERPDVVLVYGDTNSTLAGALAAVKLHIPVAHVEAGLRSFNMKMPEEVNRILTDRIAKWLFCPTSTAVSNLRIEGMGENGIQNVVNVGDVMYDAALFYSQLMKTSQGVEKEFSPGQDFYLATVHRAENVESLERLRAILAALIDIARRTPILLPLHPRTRKAIEGQGLSLANVTVLEPLGYLDMVELLQGCQGVLTDSGGLQKEAYFFEKPCITLRDETEWVELVQHGFNVLTGADTERILQAEAMFKERTCDYSLRLYGNGQAGEEIVQNLLKG